MSKDSTQIIKGIAILFMLFLHLFMKLEDASLCSDIYILNTPLSHLLTKACPPIPLYLIVSGYGLYYKYSHNSLNFNYIGKKIKELYTSYWFITIIFVIIGSFILPSKYILSLSSIIFNLTGWNVSYNSPAWYIIPYVILCIISKILISIFVKLNKFLGLFLFIIISTLLMKSLHMFDSSIVSLVSPLTHFNLLIPFSIGFFICRAFDENPEYFRHQVNPIIILTFFCIIAYVKIFLPPTIYDDIYCTLIVIGIIFMAQNNTFSVVLKWFGGISTYIWLSHYYLYNFLHEFLYSLKYPIIIFIVFTIISIAAAFIIKELNSLIILLSKGLTKAKL